MFDDFIDRFAVQWSLVGLQHASLSSYAYAPSQAGPLPRLPIRLREMLSAVANAALSIFANGTT